MSRDVKPATTVFTCDVCGEKKELPGEDSPNCSGFPRPGLDAGWSSVVHATKEEEIPAALTDSRFAWTLDYLHFCSWEHMMTFARDVHNYHSGKRGGNM